jgi:hypothetical protein
MFVLMLARNPASVKRKMIAEGEMLSKPVYAPATDSRAARKSTKLAWFSTTVRSVLFCLSTRFMIFG